MWAKEYEFVCYILPNFLTKILYQFQIMLAKANTYYNAHKTKQDKIFLKKLQNFLLTFISGRGCS